MEAQIKNSRGHSPVSPLRASEAELRQKFMWRRARSAALLLFACSTVCRLTPAQQLTLTRGPANVVVEAYAPNIVRVSMSLLKASALAEPGYGILARPQASGWTVTSDSSGNTLRSSRMVVTIAPQDAAQQRTGTRADIARFFNGSTPDAGVSIETPEGADTAAYAGVADVGAEP
jgi:alpha-D-xyloside xylohydrolase